MSIFPSDLAGDHGAHRPVDIPDRMLDHNRLARLDCLLNLREKRQIQGAFQFMILLSHAPNRAG